MQVKDLRDQSKLSIVSQFIQLLQAGGQQQGGMAGLNQFVTFLSQKDGMRRLTCYFLSSPLFLTLIDLHQGNQ